MDFSFDVMQDGMADLCAAGLFFRVFCLYDSGDNITDLSLDLLRRP